MMKKCAYIFDIDSILIFVAIGRHAHSHGITWRGMISTSWPFLVGLLAVWIAMAIWRQPIARTRSGFYIALITVFIGMVLRVIADQGTAITFCIVAITYLMLFLVGWRIVIK